MQDYEYMIKFIGTGNDPFVASSERLVDHKVLVEAMDRNGITFGGLAADTAPFPTGPWNPNNEPVWGSVYLSNLKAAWRRLVKRCVYLGVAYFFLVLPATGIVLATLLPTQGDGTTASAVPFVILVVFLTLWAFWTILVVEETKQVMPLLAGYTAVLGIILTGAAALRKAEYPSA